MHSRLSLGIEKFLFSISVLIILSTLTTFLISSYPYYSLLSLLASFTILIIFWQINLKIKSLKESNTLLSAMVSEKDMLLQEIHHRVKNNLQVVSSLLSLQSKYMKDEKAISALNEGQNRVESMVLIHQNLYKDDGNPVVNMRKYIPSLVNQIFNSYNISGGRLRVEFEIDDISLEVETVIPIGLVLNELISNALKYAFPNSEHGIVSIRLVMESNGLLLSVADNGVGINDEMIETGFGTKIIRSFARKLEGQLSIKNDQGTSVELLIKNYVRA